MTSHLELAYIGVEVPDPATLEPVFDGIVGLLPGTPTSRGAQTWRNDERVQRVIIEPGPSSDISYLGFELADRPSLGAAEARAAEAGFDVSHGTGAECAERRVDQLVAVEAPWGSRVELVCGLERSPAGFASDAAPGGFLTDGVGFGHVVVATTDFDESHRFVTEALGMAQSDWLEREIMEGVELEVRFYHCNERHHTIALARPPFEMPQKLHHIMFETKEVDDVGGAFDRALAAQVPIASGLGRHDNDAMFSFYLVSPAGFQIEVGHGARRITDDWADNRRYDRMSRWGHQPLPQA